MSTLASINTAYKEMTAADKAALKELQVSESKRVGKDVPIGDMVRAVTPGMETPAYLK